MTWGQLIAKCLLNLLLLTIVSALIVFWISLVICFAYTMLHHIPTFIILSILVFMFIVHYKSPNDEKNIDSK